MHLIEINHQEVHLHPLMEEVDHHQDMGLLAMTPGQGEDISQEGLPINIRLPQELEEDLQEVTPLDLPVPTKTEFHLLKCLPISTGPIQTELIIQQSGQLGNSTLTVS